MLAFFKGIIIGLSMAAPIGPISILCIRRSLAGGYSAGLATALGVALADGFYALLAALGLTALSSFFINQRHFLYLFGGMYLLVLGYKSLTAGPINVTRPLKSSGFIATVLQTIALTLTNPMTIASFIAAFAAFGFNAKQHTTSEAIALASGVLVGSACWFILLSVTAAFFRKRTTPFVFNLINKISGIILMLFGIVFIGAVLKNQIC